MKRSDLDDFVSSYTAGDRQKRKENERFRRFDHDVLTKRDKINLDIFWLKDDTWMIRTYCRRPTKSRPRSWRAWKRHLIASGRSRRAYAPANGGGGE